MSNDKEHDKSLADDEAFIESLYQQLPEEPPSAALDQRILAAAHREVDAKPQLVQKRPAWLKPLASAATVLLVVSVTVHQIFDPGFSTSLFSPSDEMVDDFNLSEERMSEADVVEPTLLSEPAVKAEKAQQPLAEMAIEQKQTKAVAKAAAPKPQMQDTADIALKRKEADRSVAANDMEAPASPEAVVGQLITDDKESSPSPARTVAARKKADSVIVEEEMVAGEAEGSGSQGFSEEMLSDAISSTVHDDLEKQSAEISMIALIKEEHQQLLTENVEWRFISENSDFYLISIVRSGRETVYSVDKGRFKIEPDAHELTFSSNHLYPIKNIKYID